MRATAARARLSWLLLLALCPAPAAGETLGDIVRLAQDQFPEYRAAQSAREAVKETRVQARAQFLFPVIQGSSDASYNYQDITSPFTAGNAEFAGYGYLLSLRQPVYRYDSWIALRQTDNRVVQAELDVSASYQDLLVLAAQRYFGVLGGEDGVTFAQAQREALERQLDQAKQRFEVGLIAITDVQEAQSGYDLAVADEIAAKNNLDNAREALREVTGAYPGTLAKLGEKMPLVSPNPADLGEWTRTAVQQNLRLASARAGVEAASKEIERQRAGHLPTLDVVGALGYDKSGGLFGDNEVERSQLGVELNVPIYEGGQISSRTREAVHRHQEALDLLESQLRSVERATNDAYLGVVAGVSRVQALAQAVVSTQTAVDATQAGFEVGTRTAVDVVDAERRLAQARADLARARYTYVVDTLRLKQAAGILSPADIELVNSWLVP